MKTKSVSKKQTRTAIPYEKIAAMVQKNMSAVEIAQKLNRVTAGSDPGHSIRAIISKMRTAGYKVNGKTVKLKVQGSVR